MANLLAELNQPRQPVNLLAEAQQAGPSQAEIQAAHESGVPILDAAGNVIDPPDPVRQVKERSFGERAAGVAEGLASTALTAPAALVGTVAGSFEGAARELMTGESGQDIAEKRIQQFTAPFAPVTEVGQETVGAIGEALEPLSSLPPVLPTTSQMQALGIRNVSQAAELRKLAKANRPLFDDSGLPSPNLERALKKKDIDFGALIGERDELPLVFGKNNPDQLVDSIIKRKLAAGGQADALYKFRISDGRVVVDDLGGEALKQGFRKGDISSAKTANQSTRASMVEMLRKKRAIAADRSKALDFRPSDDVGKSAMERFDFVRDRALSLRKELDSLADRGGAPDPRLIGRGGLKGREINPQLVVNDYLKGLDDLEVSIDSGTIPPKLDFKNSLISEDKTSQRIIKSLTNILAKEGPIDASRAHVIKRQIDTMLDFNKKSAAGLTDVGERFAKDVRRSINNSIREVSPEYARINDELSKSLDVMQSFDKALGGGVDAFSDNASKAVGQTLRRLMSNVQSRVNLEDALSNLDNVSREMGGTFDTDVKRLILFNKTLDDRFGTSAFTSLQGEVESAIRAGPTQAAKEFAARKAAEKIEDIRGISDTNAFNVMERILRRGSE